MSLELQRRPDLTAIIANASAFLDSEAPTQLIANGRCRCQDFHVSRFTFRQSIIRIAAEKKAAVAAFFNDIAFASFNFTSRTDECPNPTIFRSLNGI